MKNNKYEKPNRKYEEHKYEENPEPKREYEKNNYEKNPQLKNKKSQKCIKK